ncbi:hypothetical protein D9M68_859790 [compost metagenome]
MLAVVEDRHLLSQHRHGRELQEVIPWLSAIGQHHVDPPFGGVQQAAFPVSQHHQFHVVAEPGHHRTHHLGSEAAHVLAIAPGDRRVDRMIAVAHRLRSLRQAAQQKRQQQRGEPHAVRRRWRWQ